VDTKILKTCDTRKRKDWRSSYRTYHIPFIFHGLQKYLLWKFLFNAL